MLDIPPKRQLGCIGGNEKRRAGKPCASLNSTAWSFGVPQDRFIRSSDLGKTQAVRNSGRLQPAGFDFLAAVVFFSAFGAGAAAGAEAAGLGEGALPELLSPEEEEDDEEAAALLSCLAPDL